MAKEKRLGIRVDDEMKEALERYADQDGRTLSNFILKILSDWIKDKEQEQQPRKGSIKKGA